MKSREPKEIRVAPEETPEKAQGFWDRMVKDIYDLRLTAHERLQLLETLRDMGNPHHIEEDAERRQILGDVIKSVLHKTPEQVGLARTPEAPRSPERDPQSERVKNFFALAERLGLKAEERPRAIEIMKDLYVDFLDPIDVEEGLREALSMLRDGKDGGREVSQEQALAAK